jgi:hypothetical protein
MVLELARGELEGERVVAAEATVQACPVCAELWRQLVDGHEHLLAAVREGLARADLQPRQRLTGRWLAVAAGVMVAAGAALSVLDGPAPAETGSSEAIVAGVFRGASDGDLNGDGVRDAADLAVALQRSGNRL